MAFPFRYELTDTEVQVRLVGWVCARLPYSNIKAIRVAAMIFGFTEKYPNLWPWPKTGVQIIKKSGLILNFYITPENPEAFALELARKSGTTDVSTIDPDRDKTIVQIMRTTGRTMVTLALLGALAGLIAAVLAATGKLK